MRLAILGGSSPFTAGLFRALHDDPVPELREIVLQGRDVEALEAMKAFGSLHLGSIRVEASEFGANRLHWSGRCPPPESLRRP